MTVMTAMPPFAAFSAFAALTLAIVAAGSEPVDVSHDLTLGWRAILRQKLAMAWV
jgi:hypothetical protein